jgi:hypothetical protein
MLAASAAPPNVDASPPGAAWLAENPAANASIAAYIEAGDRMLTLMDAAWKIGVGLFVLVAVAWALGILPAAIRL